MTENTARSFIDTEKVSLHLREKGIDTQNKKILITNYIGSKQEEDLTEPANCNGFGRVRHFRFETDEAWVPNPLPILPAAKALNITAPSIIRAQVFQNSICNWRCWYCFVDFNLLNGDKRHSSFLSCDELLDLYLSEPNPPSMIDLSGGQPDLTPEWVPWMMEALERRGLSQNTYLWSDDNLSNDFLWRYLSDSQIELMVNNRMYSRACCFKGIDEQSFALNTKASPALFHNQFELCSRLIRAGFDLYGYVTLTASSKTDFNYTIPTFLDSIQKMNEYFPLRIVPLKIGVFRPVESRMNDVFNDMLRGQLAAIEIWKKEIQKRFNVDDIKKNITDVKLNRRNA